MSRALNIFGSFILVVGLFSGFMICVTAEVWLGIGAIASAILAAVLLFGFAEHLSNQQKLVEAANILSAPRQYYLNRYVKELLLPKLRDQFSADARFDISRSYPELDKYGNLMVEGTVFVQTQTSYSYEQFTAKFDHSESYLKLSDWIVSSIEFENNA